MTASPPYAELHLHTAYSFLDGASLPEEMIARAVELGYSALAITDHDGLHGALEFARAARAAGIAPITGAELTLVDGSHLTLLAETPTGYSNLCRLITAAHHASDRSPTASTLDHDLPISISEIGARNDRAPRLDPSLLAAHAEGLILLTGCSRGALAQLIDADRVSEATALAQHYVDLFGPTNVVVELQQNLVFGDTRRTAALVALAQRAGLPYAATGNVHYHRRERHRLQDVLVAIHHRTTLDGAHRQRRPNAEYFLHPPDDVAVRFARYPHALRTTLDIAERCASFDLNRDLTYVFPQYPTGTAETPQAVLARICREALVTRYPESTRAAAATRLEEELRLIALHQLAGFFLLYRDLLDLAREVATEIRGVASRNTLPPGRGRGSSVGSIVCYLIGLSPVDPLAHNLMLGRFLNEELSSIPDIDLDFPREIREKLIERVYERYGADHAALVCAFPTYKLRSAVRDIGKVLGLPPADLDRIAKLSEPRSARDLGAELARMPEYAARLTAPPWKHFVELAGQLSGFPRHVTQHSGGMIISSTPLVDLVPIQPAAMPGRFLCQWDKDSCDDAGFVKIDFLALGMLSLVEECLELIDHPSQPAVDLSRIDFADQQVYDMICRGDTLGVFQIESRAQIQTLLRTKPEKLEDLVVQVAIIRPGPIIGGAVNPFVRNREQQRRSPHVPFRPTYDHPLLEPALAETLGVILYQEQVLGVAMALSGFPAGQADQLRRAMSRKRSREAMVHLWTQFSNGALANGVEPATIRTVFEKLLGFAEYGFPKCHAAAFAVLAYQSAWLRCHYPAEFTCSLLNNQPMGFYPPHVLTNDAKRHGVRILPPDINDSGPRCTVEATAVRIGLGYVSGLGEEAAQRIAGERAAHGRYRSLADLVRRVPLRLEAAENLVAVGAVDCFGLGRREALWQLGLFHSPRTFGGGRTTKTPGKQLALSLPVEQDMVELRPMGPWEQMTTDYDALSLSPRYHPLGLLRPRLAPDIATSADLAHLPDGLRIRLAGLVVCRQRPGTAKGITFLLLEDEHGLVNVIVYPSLYQEQRHIVRGEPFLLIEGKLQRRDGTLNVLAHNVRPLDGARAVISPLTAPPVPPARNLDDVADHSPTKQSPPIPELHSLAPPSHNYH